MGRIDALMDARTVEEKIGQLKMVASFRARPERTRMIEGIRTGRIGSLLNFQGPKEVHAEQRLAVEESRLGIPLLLISTSSMATVRFSRLLGRKAGCSI